MKIKTIECFRLRAPVKEVRGGSSGWVTSRSAVFVKVTTDDGLIGWGEAGQTGPTIIVKHLIEQVIAPIYIEANPFDAEVLWERAYLQTRDYGQKGQVIGAISGLDIALYDIMGKAAGQPIHRLIGGRMRASVPTYATGLWYRKDGDSVEALVEEAMRFKMRGFRAMKVKVGLGDLRYDVARIGALRKALGDEIELMIDANHAFNVSTAIEFGRRVEEFDIAWLEEPTIPEDIDGYAHIRQMLRMPIAGGECDFTRFGFRHLVSRQAIDIAQPDICGSGGFTELKKIAAITNAFGVGLIPHVWNSIIGVVASLHLVASLPDCPSTANPKPFRQQSGIEFDRSENPLRDSFADGVLDFSDGYLAVPSRPGLGIELDVQQLEPWIEQDDHEKLSVVYGR
ncbi:mandelate racemase/muconate lactonizing enzyme family protein [Acidisoma silvae]|uniref:Mandelate racemase/muconate lactonizing enzyme family protein n=1 Tax=Acidisoma silvae TaxID=2802396 RepID=A0A963YX92_9PROT|nr:mandelate racemase/muconate lactonizing enzyme family protein [Acidisoma silvae]MCB8878037.1 mandelate racemase/muconate lactonizing enzyme family protein [Acidisoma silvae]